MDYKTKKCIVCGKDAVIYSGHVLKDRKKITAGWCLYHSVIPSTKPCPNLMNRKGCYGGYYAGYGKKIEERD